MYGLVARFHVKQECVADFDALTEQTVGFVWACEPDTVVYACHTVRGEDCVRVLYEMYEDEDAFHRHEETDHIRHYLRERERHLDGPPDVEVLDLVLAKGIPGGAG